MHSESTPGIAPSTVGPWLAQHAGLREPVRYALIEGGRSNLTYSVVDADGRRVVLRRPPLGGVLQSAHDVLREFRAISALAATDVPLPRTLATCADVGVTGAPFYVMEFVEGVVLDDAESADALSREARAASGLSLVDALSELHVVDPAAVGLHDLGRPEGYLQRQLRRWHRQLEQSSTRDLSLLEEVHRRLSRDVPEQSGTAIVHGDFRLGNCLLGPSGDVRAVLDWELCTLGDPLADLAWCISYWTDAGDQEPHPLSPLPTDASGFASRSDLVERYVRRTGADVESLDWYVAFVFWKLACITEGVYSRYRQGVMGAVDVDLERLGDQAASLAERSRVSCSSLGRTVA